MPVPAFILFCMPRDPLIDKVAHLKPTAIIHSDFPDYIRDVPSVFEQDSRQVHQGEAAIQKFIDIHSPPPPKARARLAAIKTKVEPPAPLKPSVPSVSAPIHKDHIISIPSVAASETQQPEEPAKKKADTPNNSPETTPATVEAQEVKEEEKPKKKRKPRAKKVTTDA